MSDFIINVRAVYASFTDALDRIKKQSGTVGNELSAAFGRINGSLSTFGIASGVSAAGIALMAKHSIDAQDEIGKLAQKVGTTAEALSELKHSAALSDVSLESLGTGLKLLGKNMVETQANTGDARDAFKALGISVVDSSGKLKSQEDVILSIAEQFANMEDGAGKTAIALRIFGRSGAELIPLLNTGAKGLKENADEARRYGIVVSGEAAKASEQFNDNLTRLGAQSRGAAQALTNSLLPALNELIQRLVDAGKESGGFGGALRRQIRDMISSDNAVDKVVELTDRIKKLKAELAEAPSKEQLKGRSIVERIFGVGRTKEDIQADLDDVTVSLERAKRIFAEGVQTSDNEAAPPRQKVQAKGLPDKEAIAEAERRLEKFRDKIREFQKQIAQSQGVESPLLDMKALIETDKEFKKMSSSQKKALLDAAEALGVEKALAIERKELEDGLAENLKENEQRRKKEIEDLNTMKEKYLDLGDPLRPLLKQLTEIRDLQEKFPEFAETWAGALFEVQNKMEDIQQAQLGVNKPIVDATEAAKDFSHAISTAFEEAVVGGKKAIDILKSFAQTIATIAFRVLVTKPLEKAVEGLAGNIFKDLPKLLGGLGGGGGGGVVTGQEFGYALGTNYVPRDGLAYLHKGEAVVPADMNSTTGFGAGKAFASGGGPSFYVDMRGASIDAVERLEQMVHQLNGTLENRAVNAVVNEVSRGGTAGSLIRGR